MLIQRLNPCSNGRCSASLAFFRLWLENVGVLILVLMEDALREFEDFVSAYKNAVLILVLMEDALRG